MSTPPATPSHDPHNPGVAATVPAGRAGVGAGLVCAALLALAAGPAILLYLHTGRGAFDEINFHEPAIRAFAQAWPRVDLSDYLSATTPGYHLLLAGLLRLLGGGEWVLRAGNLLISCALVGVLGAACALRAGGRQRAGGLRPGAAGVLVALPMVGSMYVLASGIWLLPDNLGWLFVLAVMALSLRLCRLGVEEGGRAIGLLVLAGSALVALAFVRQIHVWAAAPIWAAAWLSLPGPIARDLPRRLGRTLAAAAATVPAFFLLAYFARLWGGLTPPTFHAHFRISPAAPALTLALIGVFSVFFLPILLPSLAALWRERRGVLPGAAAIGLLAATIPATAHSMTEGRWSGIWTIAKAFEDRGLVVADRSLFMAALAALGGVCLAGWVRRAGWREGLVVLAALAAFSAAQAASFQLWQRYTEPFILMLLALLAAGGGPEPDSAAAPASRPLRPFALAGPALLALLLLAQGYLTFARAQPADYFGFTPGGERIRRFFAGDIPEPIQRPPRP